MSDILTHTEAGVLTLTFNRLDKKNSITAAMYATLADTLAAARDAAAVHVLVIQGHELIFSAGNDLADFLNDPPASADAPVWRFLHGLRSFPKPVVAAVCGAAVGIGTTLLLHCDLVYAGDNARFSLPFVNLGLCPEAASSLLLPQRIGHARAAEALLLGEPFGVEQAQEWGLVNRILPPSEANNFAQAQARKLADKPQSALIATKRLMKAASAEPVARAMAAEGEVFGPLLRGAAAREAFSAFVDKRKPDFSKV
ncbi:enoyl-CoA hydratase [Methylibium sp.]|uniref:enoyl-CoA hydratase n=1 Tax=Methylibium sp. TaxID=2067992 RepID=UPI003D09B4AE